MDYSQEIVGHKKQLTILQKAISGKTVPHAFLFIGPEGIGKKLAAIKLAQALQCSSPEERPCNHCRACRMIKEGHHPDLVIIEPDGAQVKIDQIRELQKRINFKPFEGKATVCIIDGAEKMNTAAASALLKTLEEPPSSTHLILLTENMRQIMPTIISRCQRLKFTPLSNEETENILTNNTELKKEEISPAVMISGGSPGKALNFLETFPSNERREFITTLTELTIIEEVFSFAEALAKKDNSEKLLVILEVIKFFYRDIVLSKIGADKEMFINRAEFDIINRESLKYTLESLLAIIDMISNVEAAIQQNANKRLAIETMLLTIQNNKVKTV